MARSRRTTERSAQPDPKAPLKSADLLAAAAPVLTRLTDDLLDRADKSPGVTTALQARHAAEQGRGLTAEPYVVWRRGVVVQIAAAWFLSCLFVRVLEDRGLIAPAIAGPGAEARQRLFLQSFPFLSTRDYLRAVFAELANDAAADLFDHRHNPIWLLGPSADALDALLALFRDPHGEAPAFRFGQSDTHFLGDLYQDLREDVRKEFALLQTPPFVERFILERTLSPALAAFGFDQTDIIDPTCGSGHFLLGAFDVLLQRVRQDQPALDDRDAALLALDRVFGIDINPYAAAIARFRLLLAFIEVGGFQRLAEAPRPPLHVIAADSLLHAAAAGQQDMGEMAGQSSQDWFGEDFALHDDVEAQVVCSRRFAAVVGNPPYITVKDAALRERYRKLYTAAAGKYALSAPFLQRFFQLAREGGYVGQITSNSFMKRDFGEAVVTQVLPKYNLQLVVNTAGAFIPGHGTPTILLFGRRQNPEPGTKVRAVLGKRGEPSTPEDPTQGLVWRSIADHWDELGFENDYVSVDDLKREDLNKHPWTLEGGGAVKLKALLDAPGRRKLGQFAENIGFGSFPGLDDLFVVPARVPERHGIGPELRRPLVTGEQVRDWGVEENEVVLCPYDTEQHAPVPIDYHPALLRFMWPWRRVAESVTGFGGRTRAEDGQPWWLWYRWQQARYLATFRIPFAFVATHNHFVLDRGGKAFKQSAPIVTLSPKSGENDYLSLLAYLNSSTTCFWLKQVCYPKASAVGDLSIEKGKLEANRYEFSGNLLAELPILGDAELSVLADYARTLEDLQRRREDASPRRAAERLLESSDSVDPREFVRNVELEERRLRDAMVAVQEDLDWAVYARAGLLAPAERSADEARRGDDGPEETALDPAVLAARWTSDLQLSPEQRPFLNQEPPEHLGETDAALWRKRAAAIAASKQLRLIENPVNKRKWWGARGVFGHKVATFEERAVEAAEAMIADALEDTLRSDPIPQGSRELKDRLARDPRVARLIEFVTAVRPAADPIAEQLARESMPFLAAYRYSEPGLEKFREWQHVWKLQRDVDALDERAAGLTARAEELQKEADEARATPERLAELERAAQGAVRTASEARAEAAAARKAIPVPPKYTTEDFRDGAAGFRLRGKLDVPRERFIAYPGCASDEDRDPVYGWAGWDHAHRMKALAALYNLRKQDGFAPERLLPILAGLDELLPWVKQWHNDPDPIDGRLGELFENWLDGECHEFGITRVALAGVGLPPRVTKRGTAPAASEDAPSAEPKPRGRPRKAEAATPDPVATSPEAPAAEPKRRGRPRKAETSTVDPAAASTEPASPVRKTRRKPANPAQADLLTASTEPATEE